jgi:DNA-directed RNA polymerase subunit alpha
VVAEPLGARLRPDARQRAAPRADVSLQGAAITSVQIDNVLHEFSSVAGVREDVTDIVLNLKGVALRMEVEGPKRLSISARAPRS